MISVSNWIETSYLYDNNSSRTQKQTSYSGSTNLTKYLNNDFEIENQETLDWSWNILTQTKTNKYIYLWNNKIFTVENKDNTESLVYNISDHLWWWSIDINQTWTILQKSDYYPYGSSRILERNDSYKNNYLFTWKELDSETDLQYFEVRYYNPDFGRFYSQDRVFWELWNTKRWIWVLSDPQQLNSYNYARNNPIIYVDPSGEIVDTFWDAWNVSYDIWWILWWSALYVQWVIQNNQEYKKFWLEWIKNSSIDAWSDSLATMIPWVPAWSTKIAKFTAKNGDEIWDKSKVFNNIKETKFFKDSLDLSKTKILNKWQAVYKDNKSWNYYSLDKTHKNHLEVFDSKWKHLWRGNPDNWKIIYWTKSNYKIDIK